VSLAFCGRMNRSRNEKVCWAESLPAGTSRFVGILDINQGVAVFGVTQKRRKKAAPGQFVWH